VGEVKGVENLNDYKSSPCPSKGGYKTQKGCTITDVNRVKLKAQKKGSEKSDPFFYFAA